METSVVNGEIVEKSWRTYVCFTTKIFRRSWREMLVKRAVTSSSCRG